MKKYIHYIAETDFSRGHASVNRILNNARAIVATGKYDVGLIGYGSVPYREFHEFPLHNVAYGATSLGKAWHYARRGREVRKLLEKLPQKADMIVYYGSSRRYLSHLRKYADKYCIPLVADVVEWYDPTALRFGRFGPVARDTHIGITRWVEQCDGVIAISSYLERHFRDRVDVTARVPVLVDTRIVPEEDQRIEKLFEPQYLNLVYAGMPRKKDLITDMIRVVEGLAGQGHPIKLHLLGPDRGLIESLGTPRTSEAIVFHGRIAQDKVNTYLRYADFSVLLRPDNRRSNAGFPTKFVESLNAGLPVVANVTSDLGLYLEDGYDGYIVADPQAESLRQKLEELVRLDRESLKDLKKNAKRVAERYFDYRGYSSVFDEFLGSL